MIIKDNRHTISECFKDLKEGDVFYEEETGHCYIKMVKCDIFNAVELQTGLSVEFCDDEPVTKVNATLTIE